MINSLVASDTETNWQQTSHGWLADWVVWQAISRKWKLTAVRWLDGSCFLFLNTTSWHGVLANVSALGALIMVRGSVIIDKTEEADGKCRSESCVRCTLITLQRYQPSLTPRTGCRWEIVQYQPPTALPGWRDTCQINTLDTCFECKHIFLQWKNK